MPDEETKPVKPELILDSQTVLAIAQALHIGSPPPLRLLSLPRSTSQ